MVTYWPWSIYYTYIIYYAWWQSRCPNKPNHPETRKYFHGYRRKMTSRVFDTMVRSGLATYMSGSKFLYLSLCTSVALCGTFMGTDMAAIKMLTRPCPKREWVRKGGMEMHGGWPYLNIISFFIILSWQRQSRTINKYTYIYAYACVYPHSQKNLKKSRRRLGDNDV